MTQHYRATLYNLGEVEDINPFDTLSRVVNYGKKVTENNICFLVLIERIRVLKRGKFKIDLIYTVSEGVLKRQKLNNRSITLY